MPSTSLKCKTKNADSPHQQSPECRIQCALSVATDQTMMIVTSNSTFNCTAKYNFPGFFCLVVDNKYVKIDDITAC